MDDIFDEISQAMQKGKARRAKELVTIAVKEGIDPVDILYKGLVSGMEQVGIKFKINEVFVPEVLVCARVMNMCLNDLYPLLVSKQTLPIGKVCLGTVKGDLHDVGKNMVALMMESVGLTVFDLGVNVAPEEFVETIKREECDILAMSALLTTTMGCMRDVVQAVERAGLRERVKIFVGGAPITEVFCERIGADYYAAEAVSAAQEAKAYCLGKRKAEEGKGDE